MFRLRLVFPGLLASMLLVAVAVATTAGRTAGQFAISQTGAATYSIPIWTPPGPNGLQPHIALAYNSQLGSGTVGIGWTLAGLSSITRCTSTYAQDGAPAPVSLSYADRFCLDGQRLRLTSSENLNTYGQDSTTYQTEIANFSVATAHNVVGNGPGSFTVRAKNGATYEYGNGGNSQVLLSGTVNVWLLDKVTDRAGNTMTLSYLAPSSSEVGNAIPDTISWTPTAAASTSYVYTMKFTYSPTTSVQLAGYVAGNQKLVLDKLLGIAISNSGTVVKNYVFGYANSPTTGRLELASVKECADAGATNCLAPTTMTYQPGVLGVSQPGTATGSGATNGALTTADMDGDGKSDLVFATTNANGTFQWWVQLATGSGFGAPINTGASTGVPTLLLDTFDGSAGNEILAPNGANWSVYKYNPASNSFTASPTGVPVVAGAAYSSADVDGDGLPDLVYVNSVFDGKLRVYRNTTAAGAVSFAAVVVNSVPLGTCSVSCVHQFVGDNQMPYTSVKKFDFDGDGRQDLILYLSISGANSVSTLLSRGASGFVLGTSMGVPDSSTSVIPVNWNDDACTDLVVFKQVYVSRCNGAAAQVVALANFPFMAFDWDGDGRTDLVVQTGAGAVTLYQSTGTFAVSSPLSAFSIGGGVTVLDQDGDGLDDVACSCGTGNALSVGLHHGAGQSPDLLTAVTDGNGNSSSPTYVSTAQSNYIPATDALFPNRNFSRPLYVVSRVSFSDPSSTTAGTTYSTTYSYAGGWMNLQGRDFQGFYSMSSVDSRTVALAPPSGLTEIQYFERQFPYAGMMFEDLLSNGSFALSDSVGTPPPSPFTLDPNATVYNQRYFPYFASWVNKRKEFGGPENGQQVSTAATTYDPPDTFGNFPKVTQTLTDDDPGSPSHAQSWTTAATSTWNSDPTQACALLTRQQVVYTATDGSLAVTRTKAFTPDTTACHYTEVITEPSSATYMVTEDLGYDSFGNVKSDKITGVGMEAAPRTTGILWNTTGQFPATVTNALNQQSLVTYDPLWGLLTSSTDPNGLQTKWEYDAFGRKSKETRPDQTYTQWAYSDCAGSGGCLIGSHALVATRTVHNTDGSVLTDGTDYADPVDRPLVGIQRMLAGGTYSRSESRYDSFGNVSFQAAPCLWSALTVACPSGTAYQHDVLNRLTQSQRTSTSPTAYAYSGRTLVTTDPNGNSRTTVSDVNGWLRQAKDANAYAVTLTYDAAGGRTGTTDSQGRTLWSGTVKYGISAFTTLANDISLGTWNYTYDALGELTGWSDPNGHAFQESYDLLSRPQTRTEPDLFTRWTWGTSAVADNIGKLQSVCTGTGSAPLACSASGYSENETYDARGRLSGRSITIPSYGTFNYAYAFSATTGLPSTLTYPTSTPGFALQLQYGYTNGVLQSITDISDAPNVTVWTANATNPAGQVTQETLSNGVMVINRSFDAVSQWLNSVTAGIGGGAALENQSYLHDPAGNVTLRQENNRGLNENFYYDRLNRLYYSQLSTQQSGTVTNLQLCYDNAGAACTENLPGMGYVTAKTADANQPASYTAHWTSYNYPDSIASGTESVQLSYGPDRQRWQQNYNSGTEITNYIGGLLEQVTAAGATDYRHYVYAGSKPVAILSRKSAGSTWNYVLSDHQGGIAAIVSASGALEVSESFTAYGARRDPSTWSGTASSGDLATIAGLSRTGYTFQTALGQSLGFNHMNGRVEDAATGEFLSPDPHIPDPTNTQDYNRYTYVENNPLTLMDPTGFDASDDDDSGSTCLYNVCIRYDNGDEGSQLNSKSQQQDAANGQTPVTDKTVNGGSSLGDFLRRNTGLFGGILGDLGDMLQGAATLVAGLVTFDQFDSLSVAKGAAELGRGAAGLIQIAGADVTAGIYGAVGYAYGLGRNALDVASFGTLFSHGNVLAAAGHLLMSAAIPDYGLYGGFGWGVDTLGEHPENALTSVDYRAEQHDVEFGSKLIDANDRWVHNNWGPAASGYIPAGPIGIAYVILGTGPFLLSNPFLGTHR